MNQIRLVRRQGLEINGVAFWVDGKLPDDRYLLRKEGDNDALVLSVPEMRRLWTDGQLNLVDTDPAHESRRAMMRVDFSSLPQVLQDQTRRKLRYIQAYRSDPPDTRTEATLLPIIAQVASEIRDPSPPSWIALWRWLRDDDRSSDGRIHVPATAWRGSSANKLPGAVWEIIEDCIDRNWFRKRRSAVSTWREVVAKIALANANRPAEDHLPEPSRRTVERAIAKIDAYTRMVRDRGGRAAKRALAPIGTAEVCTVPYNVLEIDHTTVNVFVIDDVLGVPLGRPWLTVALDRATRVVAGYYVSFTPPSYLAVAHCLHNAILPKDRFSADHTGEWPCWGKPGMVVADGGKEFISDSFLDVCFVLRVNVDRRPRRQPWHKGKVERFFRTIAEDLFHEMPGAARPLPQRKEGEKPWRGAAITLRDLDRVICRWIAEYYIVKTHSTLGVSPLQKWRELNQVHPIIPVNDIAIADLLLGETHEQPITSYGIRRDGLRWQSDELTSLRIQLSPGQRIKTRINPDDLRAIQVLDPRTLVYCSVPIHPDYAEYADQLTLYQHKVIRRAAKRARGASDTGPITVQELCRVRQALSEWVWRALARRKTGSSRIARFLQGGGASPPAPAALSDLGSGEGQAPNPDPVDDIPDVLDAQIDVLLDAINWRVRSGEP